MKNEKRDVNIIILKKIIDYCDKIESFIQRFGTNFDNFKLDFAFQFSCGMCIIQIGELITRMTEDFKKKYPEIEWNKIKALRNIQAHDYENADLEIVWNSLNENIPELKENLTKILDEMSESD